MRVAMLMPTSWHSSQQRPGSWGQIAHLLASGLVERGVDLTLFSSENPDTQSKLHPTDPGLHAYREYADEWARRCLRVSELFYQADEFHLIHNHYNGIPLTYSQFTDTPVLTTVCGLPSHTELSLYRKYEKRSHFVSACHATRSPRLKYAGNVYPGIDLEHYDLNEHPDEYVLFLGEIRADGGAGDAVEDLLGDVYDGRAVAALIRSKTDFVGEFY